MGKGGAEFARAKEVVGAVRAFGEEALVFDVGFQEQQAARGQGALEVGKCGAVEKVETEDEIEGSGVERRGFEIGLDEE